MKAKTIIITFMLFYIFPIQAQESTGCTNQECHGNILDAEVVHSVVSDGCETCHDQSFDNHPSREGNEFNLTGEVNQLCFDCHDEPSDTLMSHKVFANGNCIACHSPHSSGNEYLIKTEDISELCITCHNIEKSENMVKHGPVVSGQCNFCHNPHESVNAKLLKEKSPKLCFICHTNKEEVLSLPTIHEAYKGSCLQCHNPHNSKQEYLVKEELPNLCLGCHVDIKGDMQNAKTIHKIINIEKSCISCHVPHSSKNKALVINEGKELCFSCHNKEYKSKERTLKNIYKIATKSKFKHEVVESEDCTTCHFTHSSDNYFLLNGEFPFGSYADGAKPEHFNQCFTCHDSDALSLENTTTATNFRHGSKNMHYLHISLNKGRNCTLCHDIHGSAKEHLIAKSVPFGNWQMPIKFKVIENGGSCAPGCHTKLKYVR